MLDSVGNGEATGYRMPFDPVIRYFIEQDADGSLVNFDHRQYEKRVEELVRAS
ncbi:hypothetical protein [Nonomuraea sp. NPDC049480]|uniref:hypothetical protein n=1 Tax=Nonomuraea sp. NPDC049480 TaxID=3364353 RepID=UPI0037ADD272